MNADRTRHLAASLLLLLALAGAGCAGAGPAGSGSAGSRPRCSSGSEDVRPMFFIFCVESP
jgi:hypothetical protein